MPPLHSLRLIALLPVILSLIYTDTYSQCGMPPASGTISFSTSTIVNSYYPGTGNISAGSFSLTTATLDARGNSTPLAVGDLIVIMQMQGTDLNTTNSSSYGNGVNGGSASGALNDANMMAGYYEYATVSGIAGSTLNLMYGLARSYYTRSFTSSNAIRSFQVIRVPKYYDLTITAAGSITAPPWNGSTGGVIVLDAANKLTLNGSVQASALGFRGGGGKKFTGAGNGNTNGSGTLTNTDYRWNSPVTTNKNTTGGAKGEGVAGTPAYTYSTGNTTTTISSSEGYLNGSMGRGAPANGGGGGTDGKPVGADNNEYNSGGGGGANAGTGGRGGSGWHGGSGDVSSYPSGGYGGSVYTRNSLQQIIMGGGGGAGTGNNSTTSNEVNCSGGQGGGIILVRAGVYEGNGAVSANGGNAPGLTITYSTAQTDAAGGGGAGGTIVLVTTKPGATGLQNITASATGGKGGDVTTYYDHGPGGGGSGGVIYSNGALASTNVTGGDNGLTRTGSSSGSINNAYGSTAGGNGTTVTLSSIPLLTNAYGITDLCGILPVNLKSFNAVLSGNQVALTWQPDNGIQFNRFEIEYGKTGNSFSRIGSVAYEENVHEYTFIHSSVVTDRRFYRIKKIEGDGKATYSQILTVVDQEATTGNILIFPNPADASTTLQYNAAAKQWITLRIFNHSGKILMYKKLLVVKGRNYIPLPEAGNLSSGVYIVQLQADDRISTEKIMVGNN